MSNYTIKKSFHNKKGIDIWLVKMTERVDATQFRNQERLVKQAGGYYSTFVRAFVFEKEPSEQLLNEIFGGATSIEGTAQSSGVSLNKVAKIRIGDKSMTIRRDTVRDEINDGKMLAARKEYFNGMTDSTEYIKDEDLVWEDAKNVAGVFETLKRDYHKPYLSGSYISLGDYRLKYKEGIVIPEAPKTIRQRSQNFYVVLEDAKDDERTEKYTLPRIDSDSFEHEKGDRVVSSMYGEKACGVIIDKRETTTTVRKWSPFGGGENSVEEQKNVYYTVKFDNGVISGYASFMADKDGSCKEDMPEGIIDNGDYVWPQVYYRKLKTTINGINRLKEQMAGRKKQEYKDADQRSIDRYIENARKEASVWSAWESKYPEKAIEITGETQEEFDLRREKWVSEFNIQPSDYKIEGKTDKEKQEEEKERRTKLLEDAKDHIAAKNYSFPTANLKSIYTSGIVNRVMGKTPERIDSWIDELSMRWAGKSMEKKRQLEISTIVKNQVSPSSSGMKDLARAWREWLKENTDLFDTEVSLEKINQPEPEIKETPVVTLSPEEKKVNLTKRIKGLEIAYKMNPSEVLEKRLKGLKISLSLLS